VVAARAAGTRVEVTHEAEPLGTAGALKNAQHLVGTEDFLAFNGDVLTDVDLSAVLAFHRDRSAETTIVLTPVEDPSAFGVVPTDKDGKVLGFIEKPPPGTAPTNSINAGVYVMSPSVLDRIPLGAVYSAERELFPALVDDGRVFALSTDAYWIDIGTPEKYRQANMDALDGRFVTDATADATRERVLAGDRAVIDPTARLSCVCLGFGCAIGAGAEIEGSVLLPNSKVGAGARVRDSVLGEGVTIAQGAVVTEATVADGETIG
ncbi:MAG: mannose-phosphate guanylyltransferase, partial [Actinomycetota bacterium]|nr:mannose-phosphate guanylyltransferase [Actinomycetota bacterium]